MSDVHTCVITETQRGERLDKALAALLPEVSRSRLQQLMAEGHVRTADGQTVSEPKQKVKPGDTFVIAPPPPAPAEPEAQEMDLHIYYEDEHLIVLEKPAGLVVHPAAGNPDGTLVNALIAHCGESLKGIGGVARPGIVHRLDKDTSGVMMAAKSETAHRKLVEMFAAHDLERAYLAVVKGVPTPLGGTVDAPVGRHPVHRKKMAVSDRGKRAVTRYRVVENFGRKASLVECRLETGRTHQVRVHMTHLGHPLIGDALYTRPARELPAFDRQALHAAVLGFNHPITGVPLRFESPLPADMETLLEKLAGAT